MRLSFLGAAQEVTGSCFLVETANTRFLVDCGMIQGGSDALTRNHEPFKFDPASIDFVLLTHAHIDHSGLLPKLTRSGFKGPIYATAATADLLEVMLPDSAHIQESNALRHAKRAKDRKSLPALYTVHDAYQCLTHTKSVSYDKAFSPSTDVVCCYRDAGHILGSAIIEVTINEPGGATKVVFSGDLGQPNRPIVRDPTFIQEADILVIESTYGDRLHKEFSTIEDEMVSVIEETLFERRGNVIMPAFAVGRTQQVLYQLHRLISEGRMQRPHIFVDSPMATAVTHITRQHFDLFDEETRRLAHWHKRSVDIPYVRFTGSVEDSIALNKIRSGAIIISASGMCEAGRIKHHLRHNLPRPECTVLILGFQAEGTLGRRLVDGDSQVRIFGEDIPVRAAIRSIEGLSAHADQAALMRWAGAFRRPPAHTFVVHGEPPAAQALADKLHQELDWNVTVPELGHVATLPTPPEYRS
ncbi:MAG TPA: MBL fold metallo-hydrolase [Pusillimonas sp.]|uniref:MBL fold metallo-hydrolase n=1 Tax=Pusillimonas sp. TaxID=3040095 RepID=UPI002CABF86F|nr:MBL fold metallo-hydrolase [Pusillimonas sp.]HUH88780.1 MBL fold metallo-hydrolase [Pusillimonas sp.]